MLQLLGQGIEATGGGWFLREALKVAGLWGCGTIKYGSFNSGHDMFLAMMIEVLPEATVRYLWGVEAMDTVLRAHRRSWGDMVERMFLQSHDPDTIRQIVALEESPDIVHACVTCLGLSSAKTPPSERSLQNKRLCEAFERYWGDIELTVAAFNALFYYFQLASPTLVVIEAPDTLLERGSRREVFAWLDAVFRRADTKYVWSFALIKPASQFGGKTSRDRIWIRGVLKSRSLQSEVQMVGSKD